MNETDGRAPVERLVGRLRDPAPLATGPTKWRAENCTTHHHACNCREWEHACRVAEFEGAIERLQAVLRDVREWDIAGASDLTRPGLFALPLELRKRIQDALEPP